MAVVTGALLAFLGVLTFGVLPGVVIGVVLRWYSSTPAGRPTGSDHASADDEI